MSEQKKRERVEKARKEEEELYVGEERAESYQRQFEGSCSAGTGPVHGSGGEAEDPHEEDKGERRRAEREFGGVHRPGHPDYASQPATPDESPEDDADETWEQVDHQPWRASPVRKEPIHGDEPGGGGEDCLCRDVGGGKEHPDCPVPGHGMIGSDYRDEQEGDEDHKKFWSGMSDRIIVQTLRSWANGRRADPPEPRLRDLLLEASNRLSDHPAPNDDEGGEGDG